MIKFIESPGVQCKACYVYWVRRSIHSDIKTEGYVGISYDVYNRFKAHKRLRKDTNLTKALRKYDDVVCDIVETCSSHADAEVLERALRPKHFTGWNMAKGGNGGYLASEETKRKISAANRKRVYGCHTEETKKKMSESHKGKVKTAEHTKNNAASRCKPINVDGVVYPSRKAAVLELGAWHVGKTIKAGTAKYL
jgi:predicted GIY-YIG superfamily endonuclease